MVNFIRLEKSKNDALVSRESPEVYLYENRAVQLLPNDVNPYIQTTEHPAGIELEDWVVKVCNLCGDVLADITDYFMVKNIFYDDEGQNQIRWSLTNVPFDFGYQLVYLLITQTVGEDFYSTPFMITDYESNKTARFDYKDDEYDKISSTRLQTYFRQKANKDELTSYYETSTKRTVTEDLKTTSLERWKTSDFNNNTFELFRNLLYSRFLFIDLFSTNLTEAFEIPELKNNENFAQAEYMLCFDRSTVFDPLAPEVENPPTLPEFTEILWNDTLSRVARTGSLTSITVLFSWTYYPVINVKWQSWDGTDWVDVVAFTTATQLFALIVGENRFRAVGYTHYGIEVYSNVLIYTAVVPVTFAITEVGVTDGSDGLSTFRTTEASMDVPDIEEVSFLKYQVEYYLASSISPFSGVGFKAYDQNAVLRQIWVDTDEIGGTATGSHLTGIKNFMPSAYDYDSPITLLFKVRKGCQIKVTFWLYDINNNLVSSINFTAYGN